MIDNAFIKISFKLYSQISSYSDLIGTNEK